MEKPESEIALGEVFTCKVKELITC